MLVNFDLHVVLFLSYINKNIKILPFLCKNNSISKFHHSGNKHKVPFRNNT